MLKNRSRFCQWASSAFAMAVSLVLYKNYFDPWEWKHEGWSFFSIMQPENFGRDLYLYLFSSGHYLKVHQWLGSLILWLGAKDQAVLISSMFLMIGGMLTFLTFFRFAYALTRELNASALATIFFALEVVAFPMGNGHLMVVSPRYIAVLPLIFLALRYYFENSRELFLVFLLLASAVYGNPAIYVFGIFLLHDAWLVLEGELSWKKWTALWVPAGVIFLAIFLPGSKQSHGINEFITTSLRMIQGHVTFAVAGRANWAFSFLGLFLFVGILFWRKTRFNLWDFRERSMLRLIVIILAIGAASTIYWEYFFDWWPSVLIPKLHLLKVDRVLNFLAVPYFGFLISRMIQDRGIALWWTGLMLVSFVLTPTDDVFLRLASLIVMGALVFSRSIWCKRGAWTASIGIFLLVAVKPVLLLLFQGVGLKGSFADKPMAQPLTVVFLVAILGLWQLATLIIRKESWRSLWAVMTVILAVSGFLKWQGYWPVRENVDFQYIQACQWIDQNLSRSALFFMIPLGAPDLFYAQAKRSLLVSSSNFDAPVLYNGKSGALMNRWVELGLDFKNTKPIARLGEQIDRIAREMNPSKLSFFIDKYGIDYFFAIKDERLWPWPVIYENDRYAVYRVGVESAADQL